MDNVVHHCHIAMALLILQGREVQFSQPFLVREVTEFRDEAGRSALYPLVMSPVRSIERAPYLVAVLQVGADLRFIQ